MQPSIYPQDFSQKLKFCLKAKMQKKILHFKNVGIRTMIIPHITTICTFIGKISLLYGKK